MMVITNLLVETLGVGGGGGNVSVTGSLVGAGSILQVLGGRKVGATGLVVGRSICIHAEAGVALFKMMKEMAMMGLNHVAEIHHVCVHIRDSELVRKQQRPCLSCTFKMPKSGHGLPLRSPGAAALSDKTRSDDAQRRADSRVNNRQG